MNMKAVTATEVKYRILIKSGNDYFKIGTILIKRLEGDIYYIPSQRGVINSNRGIVQKIMDHINWHKSGRVHFKMRDGGHDILEVGIGESNPPKIDAPKRQVIQNIGFQGVVRDTILDFLKLPKLTKNKDELDILFDVNSYSDPIQFVFSIVSGRLIDAKWSGKKVPIREVSDEAKDKILASTKRCLGNESDNADKLLQYTLFRYSGDEELPTGRKVFIAFDSKISREYDHTKQNRTTLPDRSPKAKAGWRNVKLGEA